MEEEFYADHAPEVFCNICAHKFCPRCQQPSHLGTGCEEAKAKAEESLFDLAMAGLNFKHCPRCSTGISKGGGEDDDDAGCQHMTCGQCKYEFCWDCLSGGDEHGRLRQLVHGAAFHQNECKWFESCCLANCMLHGHGSCQRGEHSPADVSQAKRRCPACEAAGGHTMCARHVPEPRHTLRWREGDAVLFYPPPDSAQGEVHRAAVEEALGLFGGRLPSSDQLRDMDQRAAVERYTGKSMEINLETMEYEPLGDGGGGLKEAAMAAGRRRGVVVSAEHAPASYCVELVGSGGERVEAPRGRLSHCYGEAPGSFAFPECRCASCVWYARERENEVGHEAALAFHIPGEVEAQ